MIGSGFYIEFAKAAEPTRLSVNFVPSVEFRSRLTGAIGRGVTDYLESKREIESERDGLEHVF